MKELTLRKKRIFFVITILLPFLFFCLFEIGLRVFNYGQEFSLFTKKEIRGTTYHVLNPMIGAKYFSREFVVPIQPTDFFLSPKPKNTFRIFCLGGSTVTGYPYWYNASFPSFLKERLKRIFPEKEIEIINLGMTAINSFIVLDMVKELPEYEPDLIIVYDGHNEFYGPFGVASRKTILESRWINQLYFKLLDSRVFQLLRNGYNGVVKYLNHDSEKPSRAFTLELLAKGQYVPYGSKVYREGLQEFRENMEDLRSVCKKHGIPVILSTQVSNLRDQVPFLSSEADGLNKEMKDSLKKHLEAGDLAGSERRLDAALSELRKVIKIDSLYASAHFGVAGCFDMLGKSKEARLEYEKARDYDQLRFRTSGDFNRLILRMQDKEIINVVDMEKVFRAYSPDSLIGNTLILEHLHPNSYGQFLLAKGYADIMREHNILASKEEWNTHDIIPDSTLWNERIVSELDEIIAKQRTEFITSTWPFVQSNQPVPAINKNDTLKIIAEKVVEFNWGWGDAHVAAADFYFRNKDWHNLEQELKVMVQLVPYEVNPYLSLGNFYVQQKNIYEARKVFLTSLTIEPTELAYRMLGDIYRQLGNINEANNFYRKAKELR